jgi:GT2 family glycosyltransferase
MIVRKKAMDQVGLLDERYFFFFEETDWAYRMQKAQWEVYFVPTARIYHAQGKTVGMSADARIMFYRSRYIYFKKWYPKRYPLIRCVIFARLFINLLLCVVGVVVTLGLKRDLIQRLGRYVQLTGWHLKGCP